MTRATATTRAVARGRATTVAMVVTTEETAMLL